MRIDDNTGGYDPKKIAQFYDYDKQFGATSNDIIESQYGIKNGEIKDPTRYYFFYKVLLNLIRQKIPSGSTLLDLGCGMGILADKIGDKVKEYVGIDISVQRIKQAKARIQNTSCFFIAADANYLCFKDNSFDTAIAIEVIEHLPDPDIFLKEVNRVLSKGGLFILTTPTSLFFEKNIDQLYKSQHLYEFSLKKLRSLLRENSFSIKLISGIGTKLPKIKIPVYLGSDIIKYIYKSLFRTELKAGYGNPVSLEFSIISSPFFNKLYFKIKHKKIWFTLMNILGLAGKSIPFLSSNTVIVCQKS